MFCSWKRICVQQEDLDKFWHDPTSSLDFYQLKDQHFAPVDTVHIMNSANLCISGARDRAVGVWSLSALADPLEEGYAKKSFKQSLDGHRVCLHLVTTRFGKLRRQRCQVVSTLDSQSDGSRFESRPVHLLGLFSVVPSSNPLPRL